MLLKLFSLVSFNSIAMFWTMHTRTMLTAKKSIVSSMNRIATAIHAQGDEEDSASGWSVLLSTSTLGFQVLEVHDLRGTAQSWFREMSPCNEVFASDNSNEQCNHRRCGILCGDCLPGHSLMLGSNKCRNCTDKVWQTAPVIIVLVCFLAGIGLVAVSQWFGTPQYPRYQITSAMVPPGTKSLGVMQTG